MRSCFSVLFGLLALAMALSPQVTSAQSGPEKLAVVKPIVTCASLAGADLKGIGGDGSSITSATETTRVC
jgi:hypothetical protein